MELITSILLIPSKHPIESRHVTYHSHMKTDLNVRREAASAVVNVQVKLCIMHIEKGD